MGKDQIQRDKEFLEIMCMDNGLLVDVDTEENYIICKASDVNSTAELYRLLQENKSQYETPVVMYGYVIRTFKM